MPDVLVEGPCFPSRECFWSTAESLLLPTHISVRLFTVIILIAHSIHYLSETTCISLVYDCVSACSCWYKARQLYKNISVLFLFPVKDNKLSTGIINATFDASCYG